MSDGIIPVEVRLRIYLKPKSGVRVEPPEGESAEILFVNEADEHWNALVDGWSIVNDLVYGKASDFYEIDSWEVTE